MADFTPTQGRYLAFIHAYAGLHGRPPAEAEIAAALCVSPPSVNQMVKTLEKKGLVLRHPGQPRSLRILVPEDEIPPWKRRRSATSPERPGNPPRRVDATTAAPPANLYVVSVFLTGAGQREVRQQGD
ncbi:LexA family protein [Urbifossiella limnaea]|uniref:LexA repressor n=1 Tax=Urbifossiella limnaea TaxID=2528023 RepID=A0A517Y3G4_9BACT|nr:MarR family transcriptional regulator [Urbifossiella limnaea]QDU24252.1 LexA repressor [Urbifossiella limnaea]